MEPSGAGHTASESKREANGSTFEVSVRAINGTIKVLADNWENDPLVLNTMATNARTYMIVRAV